MQRSSIWIELRENMSIPYSSLITFLGLDLPYFVRGGFWITLNTVILLIAGLLLSSLFARIWPTDVYGQYSFLISALSFISLTSLPGMSQIVTQAAAENKEGVFRSAQRLIAKWSLLGTLILILGATYFYFRDNTHLALAVIVSALAFPISSAFNLYPQILNGKMLFKKAALFTTIGQLFTLTATALALLIYPNLVIVALLSTWSTALINVLLSFLANPDSRNQHNDPNLIKMGFHLSLARIFTVAADYLDRFLVPVMLGFTNNAIYAFALMIPLQIANFFKMFSTLAQPKIAEITGNQLSKDLTKKSWQLEIIIALVVGLYILAAPKIFEILYPTYQGNATFLSQIFSLSLLYYPGNLFGLALIKYRNTTDLYKINIIYAVATLLTLIMLIPMFGLLGAVLAKILTRLIYAFSQIYYFRKYFI